LDYEYTFKKLIKRKISTTTNKQKTNKKQKGRERKEEKTMT